MIINIRSNVFETNSSSTHSVSLNFPMKSDNLKEFEIVAPNDNGQIVLEGGDFSYSEIGLYEALSKMNFIAARIFAIGDEESKKRFEKVVKEYTGASEIVYDIRLSFADGKPANTFLSTEYIYAETDNYHSYDDDDDDEDDLLISFSEILKSEDKLKHFLFNKKATLTSEICFDG